MTVLYVHGVPYSSVFYVVPVYHGVVVSHPFCPALGTLLLNCLVSFCLNLGGALELSAAFISTGLERKGFMCSHKKSRNQSLLFTFIFTYCKSLSMLQMSDSVFRKTCSYLSLLHIFILYFCGNASQAIKVHKMC